MKQRWALVSMGAWLAGTVCMSVVATENFYTIDRLLDDPSSGAFASIVDQLGRPHARELLRYLSSELNRLYFQLWNGAQLVLGFLVLWLVKREGKPFGRIGDGVLLMLAIVVFMAAWLTPAIVSLGRSLDFVARDPSPPGMQRFWMLHAAYTALEIVKLIVGIIVTSWIARTVAPVPAVETDTHPR
jgi:hypothetical protein